MYPKLLLTTILGIVFAYGAYAMKPVAGCSGMAADQNLSTERQQGYVGADGMATTMHTDMVTLEPIDENSPDAVRLVSRGLSGDLEIGKLYYGRSNVANSYKDAIVKNRLNRMNDPDNHERDIVRFVDNENNMYDIEDILGSVTVKYEINAKYEGDLTMPRFIFENRELYYFYKESAKDRPIFYVSQYQLSGRGGSSLGYYGRYLNGVKKENGVRLFFPTFNSFMMKAKDSRVIALIP